MRSRASPGYPSNALIKRLVAAARNAGIDVADLEVTPDGVVRMMSARATEASRPNSFDRFEELL